jgi:two-component system, OmpR family, response regulator
MASVLIVDDDFNIRELVKLFLQNEDFDTIEAVDGLDALEKLENNKVDIIVMDIMMPNMDGWQLCNEIKSYHGDIPIIMLTAKSETSQKVKGFNLGADDYLVKPFEPIELVVRIKALLKRYNISSSKTINVGDINLNKNSLEVKLKDKSLILPKKEFELLYKLGSYPKKTFSRDELIEEIWGFDFDGEERTIDVHIRRIREKFPERDCGFIIKTIRGIGYRLEELI